MFVSLVLGIVAIRVYAKANENSPKRANDVALTVNLVEAQEEESPRSPRRCAWLRIVHALLMLVSWYMIIGAGSAFTGNARMGAFPYAQSDPVTDSLIGRCFDRNLTDPQAASAWLTGLQCGLGAYCRESSRSAGSNEYCGGVSESYNQSFA